MKNQTYIAFLRGINVGGHHKVPMAELRDEMHKLGFENVKTFLNSGNVVFEGEKKQDSELEEKIAKHLEKHFGFALPVLVRRIEVLKDLINSNPFADIEVTKDIRLYVSFLKEKPKKILELPWISDDNSYQIVEINGREIFSILDLSKSRTPKAMEILKKLFGSEITTRNWNTLNKIIRKID